MAARFWANRSYTLEKDVKQIAAHVWFGAGGAPTLDVPNSKGIQSVVRQGAGLFTFEFGAVSNGLQVNDSYVKLLAIETLPSVESIVGAAPAAVGQPALFRNDVATNSPLSPPSGVSATAQVGGGTFAAATYFWKVTGLDGTNANVLNGVTVAGVETMPSAEVSAAIALNGSALIQWTALPGATGYRVYRGTATGAENVVYQVAGGATTSFTDTNGANQAAAATPFIDTRPPIAPCSLTIQLLSGAGATADPAQGEHLYIEFVFGDSTAP